MEIFIEYDVSSEKVVLINRSIEIACWSSLYSFINDYNLPEDGIYYSENSISFPWHYFLAIKAYIHNFFKINNIKVSFSDTAVKYLKEANIVSYEHSLTLPKRGKSEIINKLVQMDFTRKLTDNQLNNVETISQLAGAATFSVPGAGKTTEALAFFFVNARSEDRLLVVAPKNAFGAWDEQLTSCIPSMRDHFHRLRGGEEAISEILKEQPRFMIITYDQFPRVKMLIADMLLQGNVFMFLDESHRIKGGRMGVRADAILDVSHLPRRKLIMSGTPMPQGAKDLVPQFSFLYPSTRVDENNVVDLMKTVYVRTTKGQLGIPPVEHRIVELEMPALQRLLYESLRNEIKRQLIHILKDNSKKELRRIGKCAMKVMQFVSNPALLSDDISFVFNKDVGELLRSSDGPKIDYVCKRTRELVKEGKKVIIWSTFVKNVELIAERLNDLGADYIHGGVDAGSEEDFDTREGKIKRFHDDNNCMVLVANPAACAEGISLHKVCQTAIYLDRSFNAAHYLQSEDRIHRLGLLPTAHPYVEFVECKDSIDQVVRSRLTLKVSNMAKALEDQSLSVEADGIDYNNDLDDEDALSSDDARAIINYFFGGGINDQVIS